MKIDFKKLAANLEKATPGPWCVFGTRHSGDLHIGKDTRLHWVGPDEDALAGVFFDMKTGRGFADAHLIAAAPDLARLALLVPELREALKWAVAYYDERNPMRTADYHGEVCRCNRCMSDASRTALAKLDALLGGE